MMVLLRRDREIIEMKLLTIAIPCYNSAAYMSKAVESLLPGGDDVEILHLLPPRSGRR